MWFLAAQATSAQGEAAVMTISFGPSVSSLFYAAQRVIGLPHRPSSLAAARRHVVQLYRAIAQNSVIETSTVVPECFSNVSVAGCGGYKFTENADA